MKLAAFDLETTGVDVETDRIVSAAFVALDHDGTVLSSRTWLINPGIPIPEGATAVHGISDRDVADALDPAPTVLDIAGVLLDTIEAGWPLVIYNAPYDLTLLDRELRRYHGQPAGLEVGGIETEGEWVEGYNPLRLIIDPLVLDKATDTYRKGSRRLVDTAPHYGVQFDGDAHGALADATAAGRVAQVLLAGPALVNYGPAAIHEAQVTWAREQSDSYGAYLRRKGDDMAADKIDGTWPIITLRSSTQPGQTQGSSAVEPKA